MRWRWVCDGASEALRGPTCKMAQVQVQGPERSGGQRHAAVRSQQSQFTIDLSQLALHVWTVLRHVGGF